MCRARQLVNKENSNSVIYCYKYSFKPTNFAAQLIYVNLVWHERQQLSYLLIFQITWLPFTSVLCGQRKGNITLIFLKIEVWKRLCVF